jgi:hypothetical protein
LMRYVYAHPEEARAKGQRAQADMEAWYGHAATAQKMVARLERVMRKDRKP